MLEISEKLHLYEFEDGETHFILAENKESAEKWYREEYADEDVVKEGYKIREVPKDTKLEISNIAEDDEFYKIVNRYRAKDEYLESLPVWTFIKWDILECEVRGQEYTLPKLIASSVS